MPTIVAVQGRHEDAGPPAVAFALADRLRADVAPVDIVRSGRRRAAVVLDELSRPDSLLAVLCARDWPEDTAWHLVSRAVKPIVVVPAACAGDTGGIDRVLLPLDGTPESASAVRETMRLFATAGAELVVLHVFDETTTPPFWDQAAHAREGWEQEFRARFQVPAQARVELRNGVAAEHVVKVADEEHADLIALGWSQRLEPGHARTVRHTVRDAAVPVMLVPLALAEGTFGPK